ncbi:hypothetical protein M2271_000042 [Streptomyces sp. LBL]|uniref:beta-galactosidase n=1 Tax=Streptomyces sp. LBL TaxID=2940562 RepID=UPI002473C5D0|nr:beta-galactosidase [Streptomyces sp. LBL]MDH6622255.1 hypothetical protein [Streptomyces sp. LBL]
MKAGGVTAVASYLIWIHHEEIEGRVRFDGDHDLRRFAELCARHGLDFIPRIGPWSHAEVRNGGLPDWLLARDCVPRTDDPGYLEPVRAWFAAIAEQLCGLDRTHGGPVVAIQIENELYDQPGHLLTLKRMPQEAGLSAPLWTATAWGGVQLPPDELLPLYGGYTEAFWTEADGGWPDTCRKHFFFTRQRDDVWSSTGMRSGCTARAPLCRSRCCPLRSGRRWWWTGQGVTESADRVFTRYAVAGGAEGVATVVPLTLLCRAGPAPETVTGVQGRASAPAEKYFDSVAAEYRVDVPDGLPAGTLLRLRWSGDVGRAYVGDMLVADQFFSGRVWDIGLDRLPVEALRTEGLRLLPLPADADADPAVYVPTEAKDGATTAAVTHAEWITGRVWRVRAG